MIGRLLLRVLGHTTLSNSNKHVQLFKAIFPESDVAKKFASVRTKIRALFLVLALYAQKKLLSDLGT